LFLLKRISMTPEVTDHATTPAKAMPVLVLQGGGALGSYQAGAYQALCHNDFMPQWLAGISIGAINSAIIAGNPPERRVERLRAFWDRVSSGLPAATAPSFFDPARKPLETEAR